MINFHFFCGAALFALSIGIATGEIDESSIPIITSSMITILPSTQKTKKMTSEQQEDSHQ